MSLGHTVTLLTARLQLLTTVGSIEDNILITKDGHENLTITPKEVAEIETLVLA